MHKNHLESLSKNINATLCPEFSRGMYIFVEVILLIKLTSLYYKSHLVTCYLITACGYLHTDSPVLLTDVFFYFAFYVCGYWYWHVMHCWEDGFWAML